MGERVFIAGYYGFGNAGDEAILQGILLSLRTKRRGLDFIVASGNPDATTRLHQVEAIDWKDVSTQIEEIKSCSLVIVGGGGLFHDYWGFREEDFLSEHQAGISAFGSPILIAHLCDIPSMIYAVGVGPLRLRASRTAMRSLIDLTDRVTVRDDASASLLMEIGYGEDELIVVADPAFCSPILSTDGMNEMVNPDQHGPTMGVSLRDWSIGIEPSTLQQSIASALDIFVSEYGGSVRFIPLQAEANNVDGDIEISRSVQQMMKFSHLSTLVSQDLDPIQRFNAFNTCDLVLGMRYHALLGSMRTGVPCVGLEYDMKVGSLMRSMGLEEYIFRLENVDDKNLAKALIRTYEDRANIVNKMAPAIKNQIAKSSRSAEIAVHLLDNNQTEGGSIHPIIRELLITKTKELTVSKNAVFSLSEEGDKHKEEFALAKDELNTALTQVELLEKLVKDVEHEREEYKTRGERLQRELSKFQDQLDTIREECDLERERVSRLKDELIELRGISRRVGEDNILLREEMTTIKTSKGWYLLTIMWRPIWKLREEVKRIARLISSRKNFYNQLLRVIFVIIPNNVRGMLFSLFNDSFNPILVSETILFSSNTSTFPDYQPQSAFTKVEVYENKISLVVVEKNEIDSVSVWIESLESQSRSPDEIVIVDNGSLDGTLEYLRDYAERTGKNIKVIELPHGSLAQCRNVGVENASNSIVAMTDFGCEMTPEWLERITSPFEMLEGIKVVAGWYKGVAHTRIGRSAIHELIPKIEWIRPEKFLPATRSIAFHKDAWKRIGGFPNWLTYAGEDTYFGLKLKETGLRWAFVPDAVVKWHAPETVSQLWNKLVVWAFGDGESGVFTSNYLKIIAQTAGLILLTISAISLILLGLLLSTNYSSLFFYISIALVVYIIIQVVVIPIRSRRNPIWFFIGQFARALGFLRGVLNRKNVYNKKYSDVKNVIFLLSGVPIDDTGGGSRGAQLAKEFIRRGMLVVYTYKFPKNETIELDLPFDHPNLFHFSLDEFDWLGFHANFKDLLANNHVRAIIEHPLSEFLKIADRIKSNGGVVIYDLIDNWNSSLGSSWYSFEIEEKIINSSQVLIASAPELVKNMERKSGRSVHLVPNAVNTIIFNSKSSYNRPEDMPEGEFNLIYVGALWGDWFDWQLLNRVALEYPQSSVIVIGDYKMQHSTHEPNIYFLGLKDQREIPAYLAHSSVAIVPWKINAITKATSPLKVFEYAAMELPIVAPKLDTLNNIPNIFLSDNDEDFIENIERARCANIVSTQVDQFISNNSWRTRVSEILQLSEELVTAILPHN